MFLSRLPIGVGIVASSLLVLNRLLSLNPSPQQARSDALGLLMGAILILVGILAQRQQPLPAETVEIDAPQGTSLSFLPPELAEELRWFSDSLLANTPTVSVVIWVKGKVVLRSGYLSTGEYLEGPIVARVRTTQKPVYLVALKFFPGRVEFSYLPEGVQAVICQPLGIEGVLILASNRPRCYSPQDLQWIDSLSRRLSHLIR